MLDDNDAPTMFLEPGEQVPCDRCGSPIRDGETFGVVPTGFDEIPEGFADVVEVMLAVEIVCTPCAQGGTREV